MNVREYMLLEYMGLEDSSTRAGECCPACGGGSTKEGTLSVSKREGLLLWKCHRASCGFAGAATSGSQAYNRTTEPMHTRGMVGRTIARESNMVDGPARQYLASKYGITDEHIARYELGWDDDSQRLAIPVQDFRGERLGVVLRSISGQQPKSKTHTEKDAISWFVNHTAPGVIIVEDQFSAIRASDFLTSVALLGTHLNEERVSQIRASKFNPVYLALDADAWSTAVKWALKYRTELRPQLIKLTKDIKDMSDEELTCLLSTL